MKKVYIILTAIFAILLSICIVRAVQIYFIILDYNYVIWCNKEDVDYIKAHSEIDTDFNVAVCKVDPYGDIRQSSSVIKNFPSISFGERLQIEGENPSVFEYIENNDSKNEVVFKSIFPYVVLSIAMIIIFNKKILPKFDIT